MQKASEMYKLSYEHDIESDLLRIEERMVEAAKSGRYSICWPSPLRAEVKEILTSLGYEMLVELCAGIKISWRCPTDEE